MKLIVTTQQSINELYKFILSFNQIYIVIETIILEHLS